MNYQNRRPERLGERIVWDKGFEAGLEEGMRLGYRKGLSEGNMRSLVGLSLESSKEDEEEAVARLKERIQQIKDLQRPG